MTGAADSESRWHFCSRWSRFSAYCKVENSSVSRKPTVMVRGYCSDLADGSWGYGAQGICGHVDLRAAKKHRPLLSPKVRGQRRSISPNQMSPINVCSSRVLFVLSLATTCFRSAVITCAVAFPSLEGCFSAILGGES